MSEEIENDSYSGRLFYSRKGEKCLCEFIIKKTDRDGCFDLNAFPELRDVDIISHQFMMEGSIKNVEKIVLPKHLKKAESYAFCTLPVKAFVWADDCPEIPYGAFEGSDIEEIVNIGNITSIGGKAFKETKIRSINIPDTVKKSPRVVSSILNSRTYLGCIMLKNLRSVLFSAAITSPIS